MKKLFFSLFMVMLFLLVLLAGVSDAKSYNMTASTVTATVYASPCIVKGIMIANNSYATQYVTLKDSTTTLAVVMASTGTAISGNTFVNFADDIGESLACDINFAAVSSVTSGSIYITVIYGKR